MPTLNSFSKTPTRASLLFAAGFALIGGCETSGVIGTPPVDNVAPEPPAPPEPFTPAVSSLSRLTDAQYRSSISDIFGEHIVVAGSLEPDNSVEGYFSVGSGYGGVSARGIEQYETMALNVAGQVMEPGAERDALMSCTPSGTTDDACAQAFIEEYGRRIWRRTLTNEEVMAHVAIANQAATTLGDFYDGLEFALAGLLQSPYFLYRVELGEDSDGDGVLEFTSLEMASRLSYFLWNTTPDDQLLDAAERGDLANEATLSEEVARMLEDDRARQGMRAFFTEIYELSRLEELIKDPEVFVHIDADVGPSAREETLLLLEDNIFNDRDFREVFRTRTTFLNRKMASIYNVPTPAREGYAPYTFSDDSPRAGILTHASFLALHSHATATSATLRGKFIRVKILCGTIPPPPADVDTSIPEPSVTATTLRERLAEHRENPVCASCHAAMDPIGLGLENFDALGRFRRLEAGAVIDPSSDVDGEPFNDAAELGELLYNHPDVPRCLTQNMYLYATGHFPTTAEEGQISELNDDFTASGFQVRELMRQLVLSPGFRQSSGLRQSVED